MGFTPPAGCPSTRPSEEPLATLTEEQVRLAAPGIYRSCASIGGLEIRVDEETNELHWYLLDERFVRHSPPGSDGTLEVVSCDGAICTVEWNEIDGSTPFRLSLWSGPTAMAFDDPSVASSSGQEWVRVAD